MLNWFDRKKQEFLKRLERTNESPFNPNSRGMLPVLSSNSDQTASVFFDHRLTPFTLTCVSTPSLVSVTMPSATSFFSSINTSGGSTRISSSSLLPLRLPHMSVDDSTCLSERICSKHGEYDASSLLEPVNGCGAT